MSKTTLTDIERMCWRLSGWQVDQRSVDALLTAVTRYAGYGPGEAPQGSGAGAPWPEGGVGGAVRPAEALGDVPAPDDASEPGNGAQGGIQRVHVTGTLTLVCAQPCDGTAPAPVVRGVAAVPEPDGQVRVCGRCRRTLALSAFTRDAKGRGGYRYACRECENTRKRDAARARKAARAAQEAREV